jgi:hypothetical protein
LARPSQKKPPVGVPSAAKKNGVLNGGAAVALLVEQRAAELYRQVVVGTVGSGLAVATRA